VPDSHLRHSSSISSVTSGDRVTFTATSTGADGPSYTWSTSGGTLSSTTGAEVTPRYYRYGCWIRTVTLNVGTTKTRCDVACPGGSCSATVGSSHSDEARDTQADFTLRSDFLPVQFGEDQQRTQGVSRRDRAQDAARSASLVGNRRSSRFV